MDTKLLFFLPENIQRLLQNSNWYLETELGDTGQLKRHTSATKCIYKIQRNMCRMVAGVQFSNFLFFSLKKQKKRKEHLQHLPTCSTCKVTINYRKRRNNPFYSKQQLLILLLQRSCHLSWNFHESVCGVCTAWGLFLQVGWLHS